MAPSFRTACLIVAPVTILAALGVLPAAAQFINPFEALFGPPPRPPSSVPAGRPQAPVPQPQGYPQDPQQSYPEQRYPGQQYPGQARPAPPDSGVQSQPLPPPDGTSAAVDPSVSAPSGQPALPGLPPGQRQPRRRAATRRYLAAARRRDRRPSRRRRRSRTRARCSPASTRSRGASLPSMPPSARPCNSARCR